MATARTADGVEVAYEAHGQGGPGVVLVHGWSCDRRFVAPQLERLRDRTRVVALDLRGHGASAPGPSYAVEDLAADVRAAAAAEGLDRPVVMGHSLGGVVALEVAASGGAAAAVLLDPAPIVGPIKELLADLRFDDDHDGSARAAFVDGAMFLPSDDPERRRWIVEQMRARPIEVAGPAFAAIGAYDGAAALARCQVPLLVIGAARPTNEPADLRASCPSVELGQTVGAGHFHQLEVPDQVGAMVDRFLHVHGLLAAP